MARFYLTNGVRYELQSEAALEPEDFRKLSTLARLEQQIKETRNVIRDEGLADEDSDGSIIGRTNVRPGGRRELTKLAQALQRQEARTARLREDLKQVLA